MAQITIKKQKFKNIKPVHSKTDQPFEEQDKVRVCDASSFRADDKRRLEGRTGILIRSFQNLGSENWNHKVLFPAPTNRHKPFTIILSSADLVKVDDE